MTKANPGNNDTHKTEDGATLEITRWPGLTDPHGERRRVQVDAFFARLSKLATAPQDQAVDKARLPGWSPALFAGDRRAAAAAQAVTALCLDYDSGDSLEDVAAAWPWRGLLHTTPSHTADNPRCRVIVLLSRSITPAEHDRIYRWALTRATAAGHTPDEATRDPSRLWFVPACQPGQTGAAIQLEGPPLDVDRTLRDARAVQAVRLDTAEEPPPIRTPHTGGGQAAIDAATGAIFASHGKTDTQPGNRHNTLLRQAFMLKQRADQGGVDWTIARAEIEAAATQNGMSANEARRVIDDAERAAANSPRPFRPTRRAPHPAIDPDDPGATEPPPGNLAPELERSPARAPDFYDLLLWTKEDKQGRRAIRATAGNALTIFESDPALQVLRFDDFRDEIVIATRPPWAIDRGHYPRPYADTDATRAGQTIERAHGVSFAPRALADTIEAAAKKQTFDPLREYIDGLEWDEKPRINQWLTEFFGAADCEYTRAVGRRWLISGIARGLCESPEGIQADHVLVLEGPQGARKSSGLRALGHGFFSDEVPDLTTKDAAISLAGVWIVELSELESLRRAEVQKTKAWVSRRVDRYRPPFGRTAVNRPRRCVFAATTNDQAYLKDTTGNRRWWPVKCGAVDVAGLAATHDQLWAEAAAAFHAGEPWWLDSRELTEQAESEQSDRVDLDPWEESLSEYIVGREFVTTSEILDHLQVERGRADRLHARRVAEVLRKLGMSERKRERTLTGREYRYHRPTVDAADDGRES